MSLSTECATAFLSLRYASRQSYHWYVTVIEKERLRQLYTTGHRGLLLKIISTNTYMYRRSRAARQILIFGRSCLGGIMHSKALVKRTRKY